MDISATQYLQLATYAAKKAPSIAIAGIRHLALGPRPGQEDADFRTVLAVAAYSSFLGDADMTSVERIQGLAGRFTPPSNQVWGIRTDFDIRNAKGVEEAVDRAILQTRGGIKESDLPKSIYAPCSGEWERPRKYKQAINDLTPQEQFNLLQEECTDKESTILYFHGGGHYLGNESTHRELVSTITGKTGGKAFSVRYRLSPQKPFPAALTDALASYEFLVNPPPGALHKAIKPSQIILAGDSAGGNLACALMATLIENEPRWTLPAGMFLISPWADLTHCLPSCDSAKNDYLPQLLGETKTHKPSKAWAADRSQRHLYCADAMVLHPLVSPIAYDGYAAAEGKKKRTCLIQCGAEERLRDEGRYLAQLLAEEGVTVQYDEYTSMPHVFHLLSPHSPASLSSYDKIAAYCRSVTRAEPIASRRVLWHSSGVERPFRPDEFREYARADVKAAMVQSRDHFGRPHKSVL